MCPLDGIMEGQLTKKSKPEMLLAALCMRLLGRFKTLSLVAETLVLVAGFLFME